MAELLKALDSIQLVEVYRALCGLSHDSPPSEKRRRGHRFEDLIYSVLLRDQLEPRIRIRRPGEEIDGSFYLEGTYLLLEAKWHAGPLPVSTIYEFKGKIDGKLVGTLGVFISMSGYSKDAADALTWGKSINALLFDRDDMDAIILDRVGFKSMLKWKLRAAAEAGVVYKTSRVNVVSAKGTQVVEASNVEAARYDPVTGKLLKVTPASQSAPDLVVVCEGETDREVLTAISQRILAESRSQRSVTIVTAMGKRSVATVTRTFSDYYPENTALLLVADGDGDPEGTAEMLTREMMGGEIPVDDWRAAIPNPGVEIWFSDFDIKALRMRRQGTGMGRMNEFMQAVSNLDLDRLKANDQSFAEFYDAILGIRPNNRRL